MTVEPATYLSSLVATSPTHTDPLSEFDGHVRLIKTVLQSTFPNLNAPVTLTPTQLNALTGAILVGGGQNISGTFGVIDPSTTNGVSVTVSAASSANGVGIKLVGNGATTTSKTLQVKGGVLSILSDAGGPIWTLSDTGSVAFPGALTTGAHTATALTSTGAVAGLSGAFTGTLTSGTSLNAPSILKSGNELLPTGVICMWSGSIASIPAGWTLCDGTNGTPNLRDRFIIGAGSSYAVAATGGATSVVLATANLPSHGHGVSDPGHGHSVTDPGHAHSVYDPSHSHSAGGWNGGTGGGTVLMNGAGTNTAFNTGSSLTGITIYSAGTGIGVNGAGTGITIQLTGSGTSFPIIPPYYAVAYIMKL